MATPIRPLVLDTELLLPRVIRFDDYVDPSALPIASTNGVGVVKPDNSTIVIAPDGTISVNLQNSYTLPIASSNTLGGVKVGQGLDILPSGALELSGYLFETTASSDNQYDIVIPNDITGFKKIKVYINGVLIRSSDISSITYDSQNTLNSIITLVDPMSNLDEITIDLT